MTDPVRTLDAVILAGGRGSRLGGVDKASIELAGERLIDRVVAAARVTTAHVIVAGPAEAGAHADAVVREDPPFSGPLAALRAALPEVAAPWFLLLSCDLRHPSAVVEQLRAGLGDELADEARDGTILVDEEGHRQWLAARYRTAAVRAHVRETPEPGTGSLRSVLGRLDLQELRSAPGSTADIDTVEALAHARAELRRASK